MSLIRYEDWDARLEDYLVGIVNRHFVWGEHDCVLCAANCALAITGTDPAKPWRGQYRDARGALNVIGAWGGMENLISHGLGQDPTSAASARRGDWMLLQSPDFDWIHQVGVCTGSRIAIAAHPSGYGLRPLRDGILAWRIG